MFSSCQALNCASGWLLAYLCPDALSSLFQGRLGALFLSR